jgi:hypothetical protein
MFSEMIFAMFIGKIVCKMFETVSGAWLFLHFFSVSNTIQLGTASF